MASNQFALLLKRERQQQGWSQSYVAKRLGTTRVTVARWELGLAFPTMSLRGPLCKLFGKHFEEFFLAEASNSSPTRLPTRGVTTRQEQLVDEEVRLLDAEKLRLEIQIRLLEIQRKQIESIIEIANRFITILDPGCGAEVRSLAIEQLLSELPKPSGVDEQEITLPTIQSVREMLEAIKLSRVQIEELPKISPSSSQEEAVGAQQIETSLRNDTLPSPISKKEDGIPTTSDTSVTASEHRNTFTGQTQPQGAWLAESASANERGNTLIALYEDAPLGLHPNDPYGSLTPTLDPHAFVGRTHLMRRLFEVLASRQSISLVGMPRIGKSSLLRHLMAPEAQQILAPADRLQRHLFVFKDLGEFVYDKDASDDFFGAISTELIAQSRNHALGLVIPEEAGAARFNRLLDQIDDQGFYPVILLDEFDKIMRNSRFGPDFFSFLRALVTSGKVSFVIATKIPLSEIAPRDVTFSPFFNVFYTYQLGALTEEEARDLITLPAERAGRAFTPEEIAWIRNAAGLHPFFIRRICYVLFEKKLQQGDWPVDMQQVRKLAYQDLLPHMQDTWFRLTDTQRSLLQDEAQQKGKKQRALPELSESAFFRNFVRKTCEVGLVQMSAEDLETALNVMNNPAALGATNLRLMKAATRRLDDDAQPTAAEKGKVIRDVLNEAFEQMQGSGVRSDTAPDWLSYNILYYRYFRHHLKNTVIAGRLGFPSDRHYYRTRTRAIEALRNILLTME